MFPPEPEKPWWYHLIWALPCMAATAMLGYWLKKPGVREVEVIKEVKVTETIYRTNTIQVPVTSNAPVQAGPLQTGETNQFLASRGVPVVTNRTAASQLGLTQVNPGQQDAPGFEVDSGAFRSRAVQTDFEVQVALDRLGYSPGSIDGFSGPQTQSALMVFQQRNGLPITGQADSATKAKLLLKEAALVTRTITTNELTQVQPLAESWTAKAEQESLAYESVLEMIAEQHHCSPRYLMRVNPTVVWNQLTAGTQVKVPHTAIKLPVVQAALVHIQLRARTLDVYDGSTNIVARFPCSIATKVEKRPVGNLTITAIAEKANYTFDPTNYPDSPEAQSGSGKLILPPGPNNPVGTTWLSLSQEGFGIHGTPDPEKVGRTTSLGCFRLSNWNAQRLAKMVRVGTPVRVDP